MAIERSLYLVSARNAGVEKGLVTDQSLEATVNQKSVSLVGAIADGMVSGQRDKEILRFMISGSRNLDHFATMLGRNGKYGPEFVSDLKDAAITTMEGLWLDQPDTVENSLVRDSIYEWTTPIDDLDSMPEEEAKRIKADYLTGKILATNVMADRTVREELTEQGLDADHIFGAGYLTKPWEELRLKPEYVIDQVAYHTNPQTAQQMIGSSLEWMRLGSFSDPDDKRQVEFKENRQAIIKRLTELSDPARLGEILQGSR